MAAIRETPILNDPAAWTGRDLQSQTDWAIALPASVMADLKAAVASVGPLAAADAYLASLDERPSFEAFASTAQTIRGQLEGGRGFVLLRGLPVVDWSADETRRALWLLGGELGWAETQDAAGRVIHDVRDIGQKFGANDTIRYFQTSQAIEFHNDGADMFALCCHRAGREGGRSLLLSAVEVFNRIADREPALAVTLQENFYFDARGQHPNGDQCQVHPIYSYHAGQLNIILKVAYIRSAQRFPDVPRLTKRQEAALDLLAKVLKEPDVALEFDAKPGDVIIASNHSLLHGRTAYEDASDQDARRHMLRLWLTLPNGRPLPPHYQNTREFGPTFARREALSSR
ncbi:MAG: TauD/TfdA family dioxygenase [Pseudomonadota bacterium]